MTYARMAFAALMLAACGDEATEEGAGAQGASTSGSGPTTGSNPTNGTTGVTSGTGSGGPQGVAVSISPKSAALAVARTLQLTAAVTGTSDEAVRFDVVEASGCGQIDAGGLYTAPAQIPDPAWCHVRATSLADGQATDTATITITSGKTTGEPGVWENVTPPAITLDASAFGNQNFGVQDVVADPVRPSDLYAFVCYQGVWRSQDYGVTWTKVSTGPGGDVIDQGRPWTAAIDVNPARDPNTPPALYTANGYGPQGGGVWKSTDWGVSWTRYEMPGDLYSLDVDPYDSAHLLAGYHEAAGMAESFDAGLTWEAIDSGTIGTSIYPFFLDTGSAATTAKTWVAVPQWNQDESTWHTADGGATWTKLDVGPHPHGGAQAFAAGNGVMYVGVLGGVFRTGDSGVTWAQVAEIPQFTQLNLSVVIGTPTRLYAGAGGATTGTQDPTLRTAPRDTFSGWTDMQPPASMTNGPKRAAVTSDGSHHILVTGNWLAGIWRYVE